MERHAEREWEQWPGRSSPEERVRGRLRALFAPSDESDAIEELIALRGKELEERSARLRLAVEELQQREARARGLHARVEQILRDGAAELDARQAELTAQGAALEQREAVLAQTEAIVEERRRELGAVELRRAAVERREEALRDREQELARRAAELAALARRLDEVGASLEGSRHPEPPVREDAYVALLAGAQYRLLVVAGPPPAPDEVVDVEGAPYRCLRAAASPLPRDDRRSALLEPVRETPADDA